MSVFMFVGPTAYHAEFNGEQLRGIKVLGPARRNSVASLIRSQNGRGVIILVDGTFQNNLAVCHAELRSALDLGWLVWGLGSMGAIRAVEMEGLGLRGYGKIFARFMADRDLPDDYVALLHGDRPPFKPVSEPLVHLEAAASEFVRLGLLSRREHDCVIQTLSQMWFGDRTIDTFVDLLRNFVASDRYDELSDSVRRFDRFRLKTNDLVCFINERPWA